MLLSQKLLNILLQGKKRLSSEAQQCIASFVGSQLTANGAFMDKNGKDELYYTSFGLMLAYVLQLNINTDHTMQWIDKQQENLSDLVSCSAYYRSRMLCRLLKAGKWNFALGQLFNTKQTLPLLTDYPHNDMYSPYSQYILLSLQEDLGIETANRQEILTSLLSYRIATGGYSNIKGSEQATTNATVAALAVKGQLCGYKDNDDIRYLFSTQDESGGFYANALAPVPDLLSTATALFMLKCYDMTPKVNATNFIEAHWQPSGGFCATLLDESCDVEYTFYGLLGLGATGG
jgi:hypothetical protein